MLSACGQIFVFDLSRSWSWTVRTWTFGQCLLAIVLAAAVGREEARPCQNDMLDRNHDLLAKTRSSGVSEFPVSSLESCSSGLVYSCAFSVNNEIVKCWQINLRIREDLLMLMKDTCHTNIYTHTHTHTYMPALSLTQSLGHAASSLSLSTTLACINTEPELELGAAVGAAK